MILLITLMTSLAPRRTKMLWERLKRSQAGLRLRLMGKFDRRIQN